MIHIGIDGGGTTTRLFLQENDAEPSYFEFPVSLKVQRGRFAASAEKFYALLADVFSIETGEFQIRPMSPTSVAIGLSGMSLPEDQEKFKRAIRAFPEFAKTKIQIESDATLTLKTVLPEGEEGILIIAGTGSVVFYQPSGGPARRIGGWGPLLSDEGSGYWIGLRALRHYINVLDGVYPPDPLSDAVASRIGRPKRTREQRGLVKRAQNDPAFVASFARDAFETAPSIRAVRDLIQEELVDLSTLLFPLFVLGIMSERKPYPLYLAGHIAQQPMMIHIIEMTFDEGDLAIHLVNERAPAAKALEIARGMA